MQGGASGSPSFSASVNAAASPSASPSVSPTVTRLHEAERRGANLSDPAAFADARRGFIAAPAGQVRDVNGAVVWDFDAFTFVKGDAPATVNPSLWRQALLNNQTGLFKVSDGIWQLRGFDIANMTLIEGASGWIVVDALTSHETAAAALAFARRHLGDRPVSAIVYTHSHVDHFGGALALLSAADAKARAVPVVAPAGFMEEATSENLLLGVAMGRRSMYLYGSRLPRSPEGLVDNGLGKAVAYGRVGLLPPTRIIHEAREELTLDGVRFVFHNMPGAEAPAELSFYLPERRAFCGSEIMSHTLHNLYTLRGAKVRDALKWAQYLDRSIALAGDAEVVFNQHHWPVWGSARIREFIERQRDAYRYIHDQTVRLMNAGLTAGEIAETLTLPQALHAHLSVRGYYGTVRHNVRAVYQHYLGWFDAHPSNLDPLPPLEAARRYVQAIGGAGRTRETAQRAYEAGEFRWSAELLRHLVLAEPNDGEAKALLARSFEQLGYAAESASWRNVYLSGALELREGPPARGIPRDTLADMLAQVPIERFLEAMAASLNGPKAAGVALRIDLVFSDLGEHYRLRIENSILHHVRLPAAAAAATAADTAPATAGADTVADARLTLTKPFFIRMMTGSAGATDLLLSSEVGISGSRIDLARFFRLLDAAPGNFPIVTR